ncbi:hypothetical protein Tsubulata_017176 [Turnera subulata]|uniref:Uncharacterized protein n=1 Tax=Turnera subulata TaxID=218843 RepID=A0A9Q0JRL1_9ROSI|nr:hypothetical protein Tsubulata_017176 [Turnera subulata]
MEESSTAGRDERVSLPKSISVTSSCYVKASQAIAATAISAAIIWNEIRKKWIGDQSQQPQKIPKDHYKEMTDLWEIERERER